MSKQLINVPFGGFYCSVHEGNLDHAVTSATQDENGETLDEKLTSALLTRGIEWPEVHLKYAQKYVELLSQQLGVPLEFESVESPRFYNYETDRIFAYIEEADLKALRERVDTETLKAVMKERFTSRDGFISHYSPYLDMWPSDLAEWDHNQCGTLLVALIKDEDLEEIYVMEDAQCNGDLDNWIWSCANEYGKRLLDVYNWMRERQDSSRQSTANSHGEAGSAPAAC